jgi:hypothetical protein
VDKATRESLALEKLYLGAVRSLKGDDRFIRFVSGLRRRFEETHDLIDLTDADDHVSIANIKGGRRVYIHELALIDGCEERILEIDNILEEMNKSDRKKKGNDGFRGSSVPPKENK